jgi:hypothetical protein
MTLGFLSGSLRACVGFGAEVGGSGLDRAERWSPVVSQRGRAAAPSGIRLLAPRLLRLPRQDNNKRNRKNREHRASEC